MPDYHPTASISDSNPNIDIVKSTGQKNEKFFAFSA